MQPIRFAGAGPLPLIDVAMCTGRGICVDACPENVLSRGNGRTFVQHPDSCTYCGICEDVCPEDAISLPFLIVSARHIGTGNGNGSGRRATSTRRQVP